MHPWVCVYTYSHHMHFYISCCDETNTESLLRHPTDVTRVAEHKIIFIFSARHVGRAKCSQRIPLKNIMQFTAIALLEIVPLWSV